MEFGPKEQLPAPILGLLGLLGKMEPEQGWGCTFDYSSASYALAGVWLGLCPWLSGIATPLDPP
jgi:hypothetical protein